MVLQLGNLGYFLSTVWYETTVLPLVSQVRFYQCCEGNEILLLLSSPWFILYSCTVQCTHTVQYTVQYVNVNCVLYSTLYRTVLYCSRDRHTAMRVPYSWVVPGTVAPRTPPTHMCVKIEEFLAKTVSVTVLYTVHYTVQSYSYPDSGVGDYPG